MEQYVVTGGCGFIGSHLVHTLIQQGKKVIVVDDLSSGFRDTLPPTARFYQEDIRDSQKIKAIMNGEISGCFHLAAVASVEKSRQEWSNTHTINSGGTLTILEAAARHKIPVVYASSAAVYGNGGPQALSESTPMNALTAYGLDKYANELHGHLGTRLYGFPTLGLRFFNVYGPGQRASSPYAGVISLFMDHLQQDKPLTIYGSGLQVRDFIYVQDVVHALDESMKKLKQAPQILAPVYNVCTGIPTSLKDLIQALESVTGKQSQILHKEERLGDIFYSLGDPRNLEKDLNIRAKTPLHQGLQNLWEETTSNRGLPFDFQDHFEGVDHG